MTSKKKKIIPAGRKVEILREHLENNISISELSERYGVHPNQIYNWKRQMFEGALDTFSGTHKNTKQKESKQNKRLREKLREKETIISEIVEDNIKLKKVSMGRINFTMDRA